MPEQLLIFLRVVKYIVIYLALGAIVTFVFYNLKKRDLFGGYVGGLVVGMIGALIGVFVLDTVFGKEIEIVFELLLRKSGVNLIAGFLGAYAALYVMNRLNHNRERKKY